jgi:hypothetical protein
MAQEFPWHSWADTEIVKLLLNAVAESAAVSKNFQQNRNIFKL